MVELKNHPNITNDPDVIFGKAEVLQRGSNATVIAIGVMLDAVMEACEDQDVTVLYYTTLEPFDTQTLLENCTSGKILICGQFYEGTFHYDVHKAFPGQSLLVEEVAFPREIFRNYGTYAEKLEYYGLTVGDIREKLKRIL